VPTAAQRQVNPGAGGRSMLLFSIFSQLVLSSHPSDVLCDVLLRSLGTPGTFSFFSIAIQHVGLIGQGLRHPLDVYAPKSHFRFHRVFFF
jgi:hypothetical protein